MLTTPKRIDRDVEELALHLGLDIKKAQWLPYKREKGFSAEFGNCTLNAMVKVKLSGGRLQNGWIFWQDKNPICSFTEAEFHSVWKSPSGQLVDVTPRKDKEREYLFVPDFKRSIRIVTHTSLPHPIVLGFKNATLNPDPAFMHLRGRPQVPILNTSNLLVEYDLATPIDNTELELIVPVT